MLLGGGGVQQALEWLGADVDDWLYRTAVIRRASEIDRERRKAEIEALGAVVGNRVAEVLAKAFGG